MKDSIRSKRWAIGDIHGCLNTLKDLLHKIAPTKDDLVIFTGDLVDRGPFSKQVIDYMIAARAADYNFQVICGNHDQMLLDVISRGNRDDIDLFIHNGGLDTLRSYDPDMMFDSTALEKVIPAQHIDFISNLPAHIELDDIILVHAGLRFTPDRMLELMYPSLHDHPITDALIQTADCDKMWLRDIGSYDFNLCRGKKLVHGHTVISLDTIKKMIDIGDRIDIDNGCVFGDKHGEDFGRLVALNLDTFQITTAKKNVKDNTISHLTNADYN